jgi:hypothetical protein
MGKTSRVLMAGIFSAAVFVGVSTSLTATTEAASIQSIMYLDDAPVPPPPPPPKKHRIQPPAPEPQPPPPMPDPAPTPNQNPDF